MADTGPVVLILGSGANVRAAQEWPKAWFDQIVVMNNAWRVRPDWDALVFPEDFPKDRLPLQVAEVQKFVEADAFVPAQNRFGGFVFAGATMAFTTAYWALDALRPSVMAFLGCDMVYPKKGDTHFYGSGTADPLRDDVSLRDLRAKSARLAVLAAAQGCACVNLSENASNLVFDRAQADALRSVQSGTPDAPQVAALREVETVLGYETPDGRYDVTGARMNVRALDEIDRGWVALFDQVSSTVARRA